MCSEQLSGPKYLSNHDRICGLDEGVQNSGFETREAEIRIILVESALLAQSGS